MIAGVPFVDVVTTMLDETLTFTAAERDEWGDPRRAPDFRWMLAYSPYDNLPPAGRRPDLLVTGALHDPRVGVHEPAKGVQGLRFVGQRFGIALTPVDRLHVARGVDEFGDDLLLARVEAGGVVRHAHGLPFREALVKVGGNCNSEQ